MNVAGFPIVAQQSTETECPGGVCFLGSTMQLTSVAPAPLASAVEGASLDAVLRRSKDGVVVANFGRGDCPWCSALEPDFGAAAAAAPRGVSFVSVPMDRAENERAVRKFGIHGYPHVAAIYKGRQLAKLPDDARRARDILRMAQEGAALAGGDAASTKATKVKVKFWIQDYGADIAKASRQYKKSKGPCLVVKKMKGCPYCDQISDLLKELHAQGKLAFNVVMVLGVQGKAVTSAPEEMEEQVPGYPFSRFLDAAGTSRQVIVGARPASAFLDLNAIALEEE